MKFLQKSDFETYVRSEILDQITGQQDERLDAAEAVALEQASAHLRPRYDAGKLLGPYVPYQFSQSYKKDQRIVLAGPAFSSTTLYEPGDMVTYSGSLYRCAQQTQGNAPTNLLYWQIVGTVGKRYFAIVEEVPSGTPPIDGSHWMEGDNRNPLLVMYTTDIALYHLLARINPRNIPELRERRFEDALAWLRQLKEGEINAFMPLAQDEDAQNLAVRFGSNTKRQHDF